MQKNEKDLSSSPGKTGSGGNLKNTIGAVALAAALVAPTVSSAQEKNVSGKEQDKKVVIVGENPAVANGDSTITWDEAVSGPNLEPDPKLGEISKKEILEYVISNKEDFYKLVDEKTFEAVYKEVLGNEKIQNFIKKMVNREDIRQAVLEGNKEYIQREIKKSIENEGFGNGASFGVILTSIIALFIWYKKSEKKEEKKEENKEENKYNKENKSGFKKSN